MDKITKTAIDPTTNTSRLSTETVISDITRELPMQTVETIKTSCTFKPTTTKTTRIKDPSR